MVTPQGQRSHTWRCLRSLNAFCWTFLYFTSLFSFSGKESLSWKFRELAALELDVNTQRYIRHDKMISALENPEFHFSESSCISMMLSDEADREFQISGTFFPCYLFIDIVFDFNNIRLLLWHIRFLFLFLNYTEYN